MKSSRSFLFKAMVQTTLILCLNNHLHAQFQSPIAKASVIYDEIPVPKGFDLSRFNPDSIHSIEIYKSENSAQLDSLTRRYGIKTKNGVVVIKTKEFERSKDYIQSKEEPTFEIVEKRPFFSQGDRGIKDYISRNLRDTQTLKSKKNSGTVYCRFIVLKNGRVNRIEILRGVSPEIDQEAIQLIQNMPAWIPGRQHGQRVNVWYTLPVNFNNNRADNYGDSNVITVLPPKYPEGPEAMAEFIRSHVVFPENIAKSDNITKVAVSFTVNKKGKIENPVVNTKVQDDFSKEAIRVINMLPDLIPGTENGVAASTKMGVVVIFDPKQK